MANIRPALHKGDLVRRKRPHDDGTVYKVTRITVDRIERRKLGLRGRTVTSSNGFVNVHVVDKLGTRSLFRRRELWRIPNQPRDKHKLRRSDHVHRIT
jgi:hypothetical protein